MKLRREQNAGFWFTATETFEISFPNGVLFPAESVNDILYIWTSPILQVNAVATHNASKRSYSHISHDQASEAAVPHRQVAPQTTSDALPCNPNNLRHLRFGHASSTTLRKHPHLRSNYDSSHCTICIRAKQTRKPLLKALHKKQHSISMKRLHLSFELTLFELYLRYPL